MSLVGFSDIMFNVVGAKKDMSDFEYLAIKEFETKRVDAEDTLTLNNTATQTDLVTKTAGGGKDMYLAEASVGGNVSNQAGGLLGRVSYILFINGVEKDRFVIKNPDESNDTGNWTHIFTTKSIKVTTGQIIKITAKNDELGVNRATTHSGKLILWEEVTGSSPAIQD